MTTAIEFYVPGRPVPQGSKVQMRGKDGRTWMKESNDTALRPWRRAITAQAREIAGWAPRQKTGAALFDGPVGVVLTFGLRHPVSHRGRVTWPTGKTLGDTDKLCRGVLDAITGPLVTDDSLVVSLTARKVWAELDVPWPEGLHVWCNHVPGFLPPRAVAR